MNRSSYNNFGYPNNYKPNSCSSSNPPSPATSTSSELDNDLSAAFCDSFCVMDFNGEVSPYARSGLTHAADVRRSSNGTEVSRSGRTSKRSSRGPKLHQEQSGEGHVLLEKQVVRALLLYVRESRLRLHENETKLRNMEKTLEAFQKSHEEQMLVLAKSFVVLQSQLTAQNSSVNPEKSEEKSPSHYRFSGIFPSNPVLFMPGDLWVPDQRSDEDPDFADLDAVATSSEQNSNNTEPSMKPLYAVVKKRRVSMPPDSPPLPPPPLNWAEEPTSMTQSPQTTPLHLSASDESNLGDNLPGIDWQTPSHFQEQLSEISSLIDNCVFEDSGSPTNSEAEDQTKPLDHKKYRPLPLTPPSHETKESTLLAKHCSGDGFYISSTLNRRRSSGRYETVNDDEKRPHAQSYTPVPRPKASQLLNKFKKKLKDTKRIVARAASKDSVASESPSISDPVFDPRVQVTVATGSVNVLTHKDDSNNNNFFPSTGNLAQQNRPYYTNPPHPAQSTHRRLDSTGDNESRSTDTSDIHFNENPPNPPASVVLCRRHQTSALENSTKTRWLQSKAPSSPNLLQPPSKSPEHRRCSLDISLRLSERSSEPEFPDPPTDTSTTTTTPSQRSLSGSNDLLSSEASLNNKLDQAGYCFEI